MIKRLLAFFDALNLRLRRVTSNGEYIGAIDGLRFMAIMPVLIFHMDSRLWRVHEKIGSPSSSDNAIHSLIKLLADSRTGVELFFVISGYVLASPFLHAFKNGLPAPSIGKFFVRRLTRLEPPYILATVGCFVFLLLAGQGGVGRESAGNYTALQSLGASLVYMHGLLFGELPRILPVAWSLEVEFQFYLLFPILVAGYLFIKNQNARMIAGVLWVLIFIAALNPLHSLIGEMMRFTLPRVLFLFALGVVLADFIQPPKPGSEAISWRGDVLFLAAMVMLSVSTPLLPDYRKPTLPWVECVRVAAFALLFWGAFHGRWAARLLNNRWVTALGGMCYTLYLLHLPIEQVLGPLIAKGLPHGSYAALFVMAGLPCLIIVFAISIAFFLAIERPCMDRHWPKKLALRLGLMAPPDETRRRDASTS